MSLLSPAEIESLIINSGIVALGSRVEIYNAAGTSLITANPLYGIGPTYVDLGIVGAVERLPISEQFSRMVISNGPPSLIQLYLSI